MDPNDFSVVNTINKGAYGQVYLAKRNDGKLFAMKVMDKNKVMKKNMIDNVRNEVKIMAISKSDFIVHLFYSLQTKDKILLFMEYMIGGDVKSLLQNLGYFEDKMAVLYVAEVTLALEYLHSKKIIHRDLKPDNMLISDKGHIKLSDFGLSEVSLEREISVHDLAFSPMNPPRNETYFRTPRQVNSLLQPIAFRNSITRKSTARALMEVDIEKSESFCEKPMKRRPEADLTEANEHGGKRMKSCHKNAATGLSGDISNINFSPPLTSACMDENRHATPLTDYESLNYTAGEDSIEVERRCCVAGGNMFAGVGGGDLNFTPDLKMPMRRKLAKSEPVSPLSKLAFTSSSSEEGNNSSRENNISSPENNISSPENNVSSSSGELIVEEEEERGNDENCDTTTSPLAKKNRWSGTMWKVPDVSTRKKSQKKKTKKRRNSTESGMEHVVHDALKNSCNKHRCPGTPLKTFINQVNQQSAQKQPFNNEGSKAHKSSTPKKHHHQQRENEAKQRQEMRGLSVTFHDCFTSLPDLPGQKRFEHQTPKRNPRVNKPHATVTRLLGTPEYLAPELLQSGQRHDSSVDWWALGVCFYEFLVGVTPFADDDVSSIFNNIMKKEIIWPEDDEFPKAAVEIINKLLASEPKKRGNGKDVRACEMFRHLSWDSRLTEEQPMFVPAPDHDEDTGYFVKQAEFEPEEPLC